MKKFLAFLTLLALMAALAACDGAPSLPSQPSEPSETAAAEQRYIWTVTVDETKSRTYGKGEVSGQYRVQLSASMEGGESPIGEYRGTIRVEYEAVLDESTSALFAMIGGTYDFDGWGENDAFTFEMTPYDHDSMMDTVAANYQGDGARVAPVMEGVAMYAAEDIPWSSCDWSASVDLDIAGVFGVSATGDETGSAGSFYSPLGGGTAGSDDSVPLRCTIHFIDESRVQFNIWSHGPLDVNLSFNGTLDKVPLSETIPAA